MRFLFVVIAFCFCSCSYHSGGMGQTTETQIQLSKNNYTFIEHAFGSSTSMSLFGINPFPGKLYAAAQQELSQKLESKTKARALINMTTDVEYTWFLIFSIKTVSISADVIEWKDSASAL